MLDTTRTHTLSAPAAVATALWLEAWLVGRAGADDVLTVMTRMAPDTPPRLQDAEGSLPFDVLLQRLRAAQVTDAWPVLPRPGRVVGWPRTVSADPCPAVLLVGRGSSSDELPLAARLLLRAGAGGWVVDDLTVRPNPHPAAPAGSGPATAPQATGEPVTALTADAVTPRAATRRFAELVEQASTDLSRLGLDRPATRPDDHRWADSLTDLPRALDTQVVALLQRAGLVLDALDQALHDDGAAVTASEAQLRAQRLRQLHGELTDLVSAVLVGATLASSGPRA